MSARYWTNGMAACAFWNVAYIRWLDANGIEYFDREHSDDEARYIRIGLRISGISRERQIWWGRAMSRSRSYVNRRVATGQARGITAAAAGPSTRTACPVQRNPDRCGRPQ